MLDETGSSQPVLELESSLPHGTRVVPGVPQTTPSSRCPGRVVQLDRWRRSFGSLIVLFLPPLNTGDQPHESINLFWDKNMNAIIPRGKLPTYFGAPRVLMVVHFRLEI